MYFALHQPQITSHGKYNLPWHSATTLPPYWNCFDMLQCYILICTDNREINRFKFTNYVIYINKTLYTNCVSIYLFTKIFDMLLWNFPVKHIWITTKTFKNNVNNNINNNNNNLYCALFNYNYSKAYINFAPLPL